MVMNDIFYQLKNILESIICIKKLIWYLYSIEFYSALKEEWNFVIVK
jgi:hypothetical protein